jgi:MFS family permease
MSTRYPGTSALFMFAFVVGLSLAGILLGGPPEPLPATAPASDFSAERAMAHVRQIAERPHPVGSADHARVRDYLIGTMEQIGLKVERQSTIVRRGTRTVRMARVENLMTRIAGTDSTGAVLLASHYDSVAAAPGAADAGSGVAALVEAMRAFKTGPAPRNDVILLLNDGEELGLLGAKAFVEQHPWARDVRMTLNFEARGTSGPAWMFETAAENGAVVAEWASLVPKPAGSSLTYEIYKRLPNDTDFTEFRKLKTAGLNFSFVGGWENYHTPGDSAAALDGGSLQHHGEAALRLLRRFASMDLATLQARDAVYFSLPVVGLAPRYSTVWAVPFAVAATVLFVIAVVRARRRREASLGGVILAALIFAAFAGASGYFGWRFGRLAGRLHERWLPEGNVLMSGAYAATMVAFVVAVWLALYVLLRKRFAAPSIALGALVVWVIAALLSSWFVAGASYVALWPLVGSVLMTAAARAERSDTSPGPGRTLAVMLLSVPAILIVWPLVDALFCTMGLAPESGAGIAALTALGLGALTIPIEFVVERRRWWPAGIAATVAVACLAVAVSETRYSDHHPKRVNVYYVMDADSQKASWAARVNGADAWTSQFLGASPQKGRPQALVAPWSSVDGVPGFLNGEAPVVNLPTPHAALVSAVPTEGGRNVTFRVTPGREGDELSVWVNGVPALDVSIDGKRVTGEPAHRAADDTAWTLNYANAPASGAVVAMTLKGSQSLTVAVVERSFGLPAVPDRTYAPRPASLMPVQEGDLTVVRRTYTF